MNLPEDDSKKFSLSTPKHLLSLIHRVWKGCPLSKRITQNVRKVVCNNISIVQKHGGVIILGVSNRVSKRNFTTIKNH